MKLRATIGLVLGCLTAASCSLLFSEGTSSGSDDASIPGDGNVFDGSTTDGQGVDALSPEFDATVSDAAMESAACQMRRQSSGWWRGEGNGNDSSQANPSNPVSIVGDNSPYGTGEVGQGFVFDNVADLGTIPDSANVFLPSGNFSVEFWVNLTALDGVLVGRDECYNDTRCRVGGAFRTWWAILFRNNRLDFTVNNSTSLSGVTVQAQTINFVPGVFYHVVAVRDVEGIPQQQFIRIYVNGIERGVTPSGGAAFDDDDAPNPNLDPLYFGGETSFKSPDKFSGRFIGTLDEIVYYNYALTSDQIELLRDESCPSPP